MREFLALNRENKTNTVYTKEKQVVIDKVFMNVVKTNSHTQEAFISAPLTIKDVGVEQKFFVFANEECALKCLFRGMDIEQLKVLKQSMSPQLRLKRSVEGKKF